MTLIFYIIKDGKFYFFEDNKEARKKEKELAKKYGYRKDFEDVPKYFIKTVELPNYYGTVWVAYKDGYYYIESHWNKIKNLKDRNFKIKKYVLSPYEEKQRKRKKSELSEKTKKQIDNADLTKIFKD